MKQNPTTQWANAGLSPSPEAIRDHLLIGLLQEGSPIPEDYPELLSDSGIVFAGSWFGLAQIHVVAVDAYAYIRGLGQTSYSEAHLVVNLLELFRELFSRDQHVFVFKIQSELMCLVCGVTAEDADSALANAAETMLDAAEHIDGVRLFASVSGIHKNFNGIQSAKQEVREISEYRILHMDVTPMCRPDVLSASHTETDSRSDIAKERQLLQHFRAGRYRDACDVFADLFEREYLALANPLILLKHKCAQFQSALLTCCQSMVEEDISGRMLSFAPEKRLLEATTYPEVRAQMEHLLGHLNDIILSTRKDGGASWITDVKDYIRSSYTNPDLNVNSVADAFGKNPSYLSRSFLKLTGTSILDYIHYYRIQEAKILIGRGETLATAAAAVGYSSVLTMSRAFKRYEGTTPGRLKA